jgi:hypothetical protein
LQQGTIIPAHPLALRQSLEIDEARQRLLTGIIWHVVREEWPLVFILPSLKIRKPDTHLLEPLLRMAAEEN